MITAQEMNDVYGDFIESFKKPLNIDFSKGLTIIPNDSKDAFQLSDPACTNLMLSKTENGGVVVRYAFTYDQAESLKDYKEGLRFLSVIQNQMVTAISPWIDWTKPVPNLFRLPNRPAKFFLESHTGFELRAYYDGSI